MRPFISLVAAAIVVGCSGGQPNASINASPVVPSVAPTVPPPSPTDIGPSATPSGTLSPLSLDRLPTSGWILFSSDANRVSTVIRVAPNGQKATEILAGSHPDWSPDGEMLAFSCVTEPNAEPQTLGTCLSRADGSGKTTLIRDGYGAKFSPDGARIAYLRGFIDVLDVYVNELRPPTGGQLVGQSDAFVKWSPDGERLLLHAEAGRLAIVDLAGTTLQTFDGYVGAWNPDGGTLAYFRIVGSGATLQLADAATGRVTAPGYAPGSPPESIVWLGSDRLLVQLAGDLWRLDLSRPTEPVRLTVGLEIDWPTLSVSPDLQWVAFTKTAGQDAGLYVASVNGGWALIVPAIQLRNPDWQPAP